MRSLDDLRAIIRCGACAESLSDEELFRVASQAKLPIMASATAIWALREGLPVLHELARRFGEVCTLPEQIGEPDTAA